MELTARRSDGTPKDPTRDRASFLGLASSCQRLPLQGQIPRMIPPHQSTDVVPTSLFRASEIAHQSVRNMCVGRDD